MEKAAATVAAGFDFARVDNRSGKGRKKRRNRTETDSSRKGEADTLFAMKLTSSGMFPYQMVRYWAKNSPAHNRLNPNMTTEISDRNDGVSGSSVRGGAPWTRMQRIAATENPA